MQEQEIELSVLKERLSDIIAMGWVVNKRPGNTGGVGNTLEDLLDVAENNLQLPDFGEWELKSQREKTSFLLTLFHDEPRPRNAKIVSQILLLKYGWPHQEAGIKYPADERSFRQTIKTTSYSDRGFKVNIDYHEKNVFINFNFYLIDDMHSQWREEVKRRAGTGDINPNPYWTFEDIENKLQTKLSNLMYVKADSKIENGFEYFRYKQIEAYANPSLERFLHLMEEGLIYVDFDARTGKNHGTKFRIKPSAKQDLYQSRIIV